MQLVSLVILEILVTVALVVVPVVGTPLIAARKGFKWYYWVLAGSLFGLLLVAILPAANQPRLSEEEQERRRHKGDRAGSGLTFFSVGVVVVSIVLSARDAFRETPGKGAAPQVQATVWESRFHPIRVAYGSPWTMLKGCYDFEDSAAVAFIDNSDGKSYVISVGPDVPRADAADEDFFDAVRETMFNSHEDNRLIDETDQQFHGAACHRFRFKMHTQKWGTMCCCIHVRRTGERCTSVQWSFPCGPGTPDPDRIPPEIESLDRGVVLFESEGR